jgi:hypothetical protein
MISLCPNAAVIDDGDLRPELKRIYQAIWVNDISSCSAASVQVIMKFARNSTATHQNPAPKSGVPTKSWSFSRFHNVIITH